MLKVANDSQLVTKRQKKVPYSAKFWRGKFWRVNRFRILAVENVGEFTVAYISYF